MDIMHTDNRTRINEEEETSFTDALKQKYCIDEEDEQQTTVGFIIIKSPKRRSSSAAQKQAELAHLSTVVLNGVNLKCAGIPQQGLASLCPNIVDLDLANNLFSHWSEVLAILSHLPKIKYVNISKNTLQLDCADELPDTNLTVENLALNYTGITIQEMVILSKIMPVLKELHLCGNDYEILGGIDKSIKQGHFAMLECLRLNNNNIKSWSEVWKLRHLPQLKRLLLSGNPLMDIFYYEEEDSSTFSLDDQTEDSHHPEKLNNIVSDDGIFLHLSTTDCEDLIDESNEVECEFQDLSFSTLEYDEDADFDGRPFSRIARHDDSIVTDDDDGCGSDREDNKNINFNNSGHLPHKKCLYETTNNDNEDYYGLGFPSQEDFDAAVDAAVMESLLETEALLEEEEDEWHKAVAEAFLQEIIDNLVADQAVEGMTLEPDIFIPMLEDVVTAPLEDVISQQLNEEWNGSSSSDSSLTEEYNNSLTSDSLLVDNQVESDKGLEVTRQDSMTSDSAFHNNKIEAKIVQEQSSQSSLTSENSSFGFSVQSNSTSVLISLKHQCENNVPSENLMEEENYSKITKAESSTKTVHNFSCENHSVSEVSNNSSLCDTQAHSNFNQNAILDSSIQLPNSSIDNVATSFIKEQLPKVISEDLCGVMEKEDKGTHETLFNKKENLFKSETIPRKDHQSCSPCVNISSSVANFSQNISLNDSAVTNQTDHFMSDADTGAMSPCHQCHCPNLQNNNFLPFQHLENLCLSEAKISHWKPLLALQDFPQLTSVRMLENPLYSAVQPDDRRKLYISILPKVTNLNGSEVTKSEREKAERHYLRHFMDHEDKPDNYQTLVEKHGPPVQLVDIDLSAGYQEFVSMTFILNDRSEYVKPSFSKKIHMQGSMGKLRKLISKEMDLPQSSFTMFHLPCAAGHPEYEREIIELRCEGLPMSRFDFLDGDEIHIEMKPHNVILYT